MADNGSRYRPISARPRKPLRRHHVATPLIVEPRSIGEIVDTDPDPEEVSVPTGQPVKSKASTS